MLSNLISNLGQWAVAVISTTGYAGVFILSLLESAAIPIPSEVVVPFAGFLAAKGTFSLAGVIIVATLANLAGGLILYWIAKSGGRWILEKYGKWVFVSHDELARADKLFAKQGSKIILLGRLLPVVRTFISLPAGVAKMAVGRFIFYTVAGSLIWNAVLAYVGYQAGENWEILRPYLHRLDYLIAGLVLIGIVWFIIRHKKKK